MKTVLVVDDSAFMRRTMKSILLRNSFRVVGEATNGVEAVAEYKKLRPDIVTLDVVMQEMDGLVTLKTIMKIAPNANIIMVSSMGQDIIVRESIVLGAKNFILKPFTEEQVLRAIDKLDESPVE
ncbi:MAG: response regulator [Oscillospiraceae bacterium]|nr:response regulator [Oscillospiraceae bacterium]MCL2278491.1 response regulator [Oscillospiraceae bacterium]